tara:strand:+ start:1401 stop:2180 length:780 start_codon:yes stop_codon:yes gene_type:complete
MEQSFKDDLFALYEKNMELSNFIDINPISVSTITFISKFNQTIDTMLLNNNFICPKSTLCKIQKPKDHHEYELTARGKSRMSFYNQITITYQNWTKKSIKLFSNGKVQMTGLTSYNEAISSLELVQQILLLSLDILVKYNPPSIAMINTNFSFKNYINILKLKTLLIKENYNVIYNPEVYPGLKITSPDFKISVFFFNTGNVVITGTNCLRNLKLTFSKIVEIVTLNTDIHIKATPTKKIQKQNNFIMGYKERDYIAFK